MLLHKQRKEMVMFYRFENGKVVNVNAIQMIEPVKFDRLYKDEYTLYSFANYFLNDIYAEEELVAFGIVRNEGCLSVNKNKAMCKNDFVVGYVVHLGAPSGGINNSHVTVNISHDEYCSLMSFIEKNFKNNF